MVGANQLAQTILAKVGPGCKKFLTKMIPAKIGGRQTPAKMLPVSPPRANTPGRERHSRCARRSPRRPDAPARPLPCLHPGSNPGLRSYCRWWAAFVGILDGQDPVGRAGAVHFKPELAKEAPGPGVKQHRAYQNRGGKSLKRRDSSWPCIALRVAKDGYSALSAVLRTFVESFFIRPTSNYTCLGRRSII